MTQLQHLTRVLGGFFFSLTLFVASARADVEDYDSSSFITSESVKIEPDTHTGTFVYSYPITIPPGRNGLAPSLSLNYNSSNKENSNLVGYGWALSLPSIERIARYGSDDLYSKHIFNSSLSGELKDVSLSDDSHGTYGAKIDDGSFLKYEYNDDETWTVTDKKGVVYTFGSSDDDRVSDPDDTTHVFRWMLSKIEDPDGNTVTYTYTKDENQVYPSSINYTGHDSESGIFDIIFSFESRSDIFTSYASGFEIKTAQRLATIEVQISGETVRSYAVSYTTGDNGARSLLESITETGTDEEGTSLTKPSTRFEYTTSERSWTEDEDFGGLPLVVAGSGSGSLGVYIFDVNADGFPDVVKSRSGSDQAVYINNGDETWTEDTAYVIPVYFLISTGKDRGVRVADVNGDGYQDLIYSRTTSSSSESAVYINNADGTGWAEDTSLSVPITFVSEAGLDFGVRIFDVDGDGMQDIVKGRGSDSTDYFYMNNGDGTGWTLDTGYSLPVKFNTTSDFDNGVRMMDINSDGLIDLVYARYDSSGSTTYSAVYINKGDGTGWAEDTSYTVPAMFIFSSGKDRGLRESDLNADGLPDFLYSRLNSVGEQEDAIYVHDGDETGWTEDTSLSLPLAFTTDGGLDIGVRLLDINGDGLDDILYSQTDASGSTSQRLWVADGGHSDLLSSVTNSYGGETSITYESEVEPGGNLFFPMQVVLSITNDDGLGNSSTTTYDYSEADYYYADAYDRKFSGFGKVTVTDAAGNTTVRYYHQGNETNSDEGESIEDISKAGKPYREDIYDSTEHLYRTIIYTWTNTDLGDDRDFVYQNQVLELLYDSDDDHTDKAVTYTYDEDSGNLTEEKQWGEVIGEESGDFSDSDETDNIFTSYTYAEWSDGETSALLTSKKITDNEGITYKETRLYYDELSFGSVSQGHVTEESQWVSGSDYASFTFTYDDYGFRTSLTDPKGFITTLEPDSAEMYVAIQTDPLGATTSFEYDYSLGKVKETTDSNGFVFSRTYDAFDRPVQDIQPDSDDPSALVVKTSWSYDDSAIPVFVHQTDSFDDSNNRETYIYIDGFGREIQQRQEIEGSSYSVLDTIYNELGRVEKKSLPYNQSGSAYTEPTTTTALYISYTYDVLGRLTSSANAEGSTTQSYEDGVMTSVDRNNKTKTYTKDAYDRLVGVGEKSGPSVTFTTTYNWDPVGRLTQITDAENNVRAFGYDGLDHRLTAQDLHQSTDTEFGTWTFTYDDNGNLETLLSPNGITTIYTYDELNRVETEDADSTTATDITYEYDTCDNGIGRLCIAIVDGGATTSYSYNAMGQASEEIKIISGTSYTTSYTFDRQGQLSSLTYPDGSSAQFYLNEVGHIREARFTDVSGSFTTVANNIAYTPHGKISSITYGNGAVSTYQYNTNDLYRLMGARTTLGSSRIQDFSYGYDPVGNLTRVVDSSSLYASMTISYQYDDLHRLIQASSTSSSTALTYSKTWNYGATGNILSSSDSGTYNYSGYLTGSYANPHAATMVGSIPQNYDQNGNLTVNGLWNNTWNARNELTQSTNGTITLTNTYDHTGKRVYQSSSSGRIGVYPNSFYDIDGTIAQRHIPLGDFGLIATSRRPVSGTGASQMVYHHRDHLGGTHVDTSSTGSALEYIVYKPFGDILLDTVAAGGSNNRYKFTGKEKDTETGWYYFEARYYAGSSGRFLSQDPLFLSLGTDEKVLQKILGEPQKLNSYSYTENNPVSRIDPTGESSELAWGIPGRNVVTGFNFFLGITGAAISKPWLPISSIFMNHSLAINPRDLYITVNNQKYYGNVINAIWGSSEFEKIKNSVQNLTQEAEAGGVNTISLKQGINFSSNNDLRLSIRNVTATVIGNQENGQWNYTVYIYDLYDFTPESTSDRVTSGLVNVGYANQVIGVITPYDVHIRFTYSQEQEQK